jgi:hypothetical protein
MSEENIPSENEINAKVDDVAKDDKDKDKDKEEKRNKKVITVN